MSQKMGYWVDLQSVSFDEHDGKTWIQAMPLGNYDHPVYGAIEITPERVQHFATNVKNKVRGQDLDIDYDHKAKSGEAAGWIEDADARGDGLYVLVNWTKQAAQSIKDKAYRYFSPEFVDEWDHPKTGEKFQDVLFGGGLTNRPFLKDIQPINMSELFAEQNTGGGMDPKLIRQLLGLPEDATDEQVNTALEERSKEESKNQDGSEGGNENEGEGEGSNENQPDPLLVMASEGKTNLEVIRKLAEDNPAVKALADMVEAQGKQIEMQTNALRLSEAQTRVLKLTEGKKVAFPAKTTTKLTEILVEAPKQLSDKIYAMFEEITKDGLVELGERGALTPASGTKTAHETFEGAIRKKMSEEKVSYADAAAAVGLEEPELFENYRAEMIG